MERIIKKIIYMDNQAKDAVRRAQDARASLEEEVTQLLAQTRAEKKARADKKLDALLEEENRDFNRRLKQLEDEQARQIKALRSIEIVNHKHWADALFTEIISENP